MSDSDETTEFELPERAAEQARTWSTRTLAAAAVAALVVGAGGATALGAVSKGGNSQGGPGGGNFQRMNSGEGGMPQFPGSPPGGQTGQAPPAPTGQSSITKPSSDKT